MSERVLGVIIAVAIGIGICKLIWSGLNWLQVFMMRRRVIRRRLGLSPWRFRRGRWWIFGPGPRDPNGGAAEGC